MVQLVLSAPETWLAVIGVGALEWGFFNWFQPGRAMAAASGGLGLLLLALWPVIYIRSEVFDRRYYRSPEAVNSEDLEKRLEACHLSFRKPALACLALARQIRQEFTHAEFQDEVESLLGNLNELTRNHVELLDRSRRFGTPEQKETMARLLRDQADSVENSLTALQRFSGNLTLFDLHLKDQKEIDGELKAINVGLQDAIQEIHPGEIQ
jgi:signal transduction histidine kinase